MNYELAKELRDAGFPQIGAGESVFAPDRTEWTADDMAYAPTLSELIEACGQDFWAMTHHNKLDAEHQWKAVAIKNSQRAEEVGLGQVENNWYEAWGQTAEIAVARLWLSLNKKTPA